MQVLWGESFGAMEEAGRSSRAAYSRRGDCCVGTHGATLSTVGKSIVIVVRRRFVVTDGEFTQVVHRTVVDIHIYLAAYAFDAADVGVLPELPLSVEAGDASRNSGAIQKG